MKIARKFWQDAMDELIRPEIDFKVKVASLNVWKPYMYNETWKDPKSNSTTSLNGDVYVYANCIGNGFRVGDSRCVLCEEDTAQYYVPNSLANKAAALSLNPLRAPFAKIDFVEGVYKILLWNIKHVYFEINALDSADNVLDTQSITVNLSEYKDEYIVEIDTAALFPNWDSNYKSLDIEITSDNLIIFAGFFTPDDYYFSWGVQDIVSIKCGESLELISGEVPHQTLELTVYDEAGDFDPTNPNGYYHKFISLMPGYFYLGIDGAYLIPELLYSTGDVKYDRHQLTIEFDTPWQANNSTSYIPATYLGGVGDDLRQYNVWTNSLNDSLEGYKTNAATSESQWKGEIDQLRLSSVGGFAFYNETYSVDKSRLGCKATELQNLDAQDYHIRARDIKDTFATLEKKALLGDIKVTKYRYYISNESKTVSASKTERTDLSSIVVPLPEWCRHGARFDMSTLSAVDSDGNTVSQANLNWIVQENSYSGVEIIVAHSDNTTRLVSASLSGTIHYWAQEALSVTTETVNSGGEECAIDNPFVTTDAQVKAILDSVKYVYGHRDVYRAQWAQDWRVELGDIIYLDTQFETDVKCVVTGLKFSYPGLWGEITLRRID